MSFNRVTIWLEPSLMEERKPTPEPDFSMQKSLAVPQFNLAPVSIYEAARAAAVREIAIDRLFNAEYYKATE